MPLPRLVVIPTSDRDFERTVRETVAPDGTPGRLQESLRARYPRAVVRARDLAGEMPRVWYVYREGVWTAS